MDADGSGYFDTIDHEWMVRMVAERIDAGALLRLIRKWLKAGVLDTDGQVLHPVTGTPQGVTVSPPYLPMCSYTTCSMSGLKKWSNGTVEAKRVCSAPPTISCARSKTKQMRNASTTCWGNG